MDGEAGPINSPPCASTRVFGKKKGVRGMWEKGKGGIGKWGGVKKREGKTSVFQPQFLQLPGWKEKKISKGGGVAIENQKKERGKNKVQKHCRKTSGKKRLPCHLYKKSVACTAVKATWSQKRGLGRKKRAAVRHQSA